MEINENHLKINESQSKPRVASAGIAKPSNNKTESCVVFKYPPTSSERRASGNKQTSNEQTSNERRATSHESRATIADRQSPIDDRGPPIADHGPPTADR